MKQKLIINNKEVNHYKLEIYEKRICVLSQINASMRFPFGHIAYYRQYISVSDITSVWYEETPESEFFDCPPEHFVEAEVKTELHCTEAELKNIFNVLKSVSQKSEFCVHVIPLYVDERLQKKLTQKNPFEFYFKCEMPKPINK